MKKPIGVLALILTGSLAFGQQSMTLKEAQTYALQHNSDVLNARADLLIAEKTVSETRAIGLPQVNGEVTFQNFLTIPTTLIPASAFADPSQPAPPDDTFIEAQFGTDYNTTASLTATQLIFDGSYLVGLRAVKEYRNISEQGIKRTELETMDQVAQAYYTAMVARENTRVFKATLETMEKLQLETEAIHENGLIEEQDVDQIRLTVANIRSGVSRAERTEEVTLQLLKLQMGMDVKAAVTLTDEMESIVEGVDPEVLLGKEFNPKAYVDYQMLETQEALQVLDMKNERADYLPSLAAFFTHSQNNLGNELKLGDSDAWYPTTLWGLNLNVPIFSSGQRRAQVQKAQLEVEKVNNQMSQVESALTMQATSARANYRSAYEVFQNEEDNLDLAERIQARTLVKYKEGLASSFDLNQAQSQYLSTQGNYIKAMFDLLSAKAALDKLHNTY